MSDQSARLPLSALWDTARGKLISALVIAALLLGILAELISVISGYYTIRKLRCDLAISAVEAKAKSSTLDLRHPKAAKEHDFLSDCLND